MRAVEFAILGPLRIGGPGGVIRIGAPKQRALLAALLLAYRDDGVSTSRLIDMLAGDPRGGARSWGAAGALRVAAGATRQPDEAAFAERVEATLRNAVGPDVFTDAVAEVAALPQADAVALALS